MGRRPERLGSSWANADSSDACKLAMGSKLIRQLIPAILLVGPPGVGKSTLGRAVTKEIGSHLHELTARPDIGALSWSRFCWT